jgi:hypothetical protein
MLRHQLSRKQWIVMFWQMKNYTYAGNFGFVGFKNGFDHRQIN